MSFQVKKHAPGCILGEIQSYKIVSERFSVSLLVQEIFEKKHQSWSKWPKLGWYNSLTIGPISKQKTPIKC